MCKYPEVEELHKWYFRHLCIDVEIYIHNMNGICTCVYLVNIFIHTGIDQSHTLYIWATSL